MTADAVIQDLLPAAHPLVAGGTASSALVRAALGDRPETLPVWFMRQAGRSLPEYRAARRGTAMLEACLTPELAAEITLQPVRRHGVDAAIFFSDIVVPLACAGVDVSIEPGVGPVFAEPIRTADAVATLPDIQSPTGREAYLAALEPVAQAVQMVVAELGDKPVIGFAGAPFTLAAYMVDGRPTRDHLGARGLMLSAPQVWKALAEWTSLAAGLFLEAQVRAGASAVQVFDSWAGVLDESVYRTHCLPHTARVFSTVQDERVPRIHFATQSTHLLKAMVTAGGTAMGVDYRTPLDEAAALLPGVPLQGNLDPAILTAPWDVVEAHVTDVVTRGYSAPGHVVNLGHGVPPETDPDVLTRIVDLVHSLPAHAR